MIQGFGNNWKLEAGDVFTPLFSKCGRDSRKTKAGKKFNSCYIKANTTEGEVYLSLSSEFQADQLDKAISGGIVECEAYAYKNKLGKDCVGIRAKGSKTPTKPAKESTKKLSLVSADALPFLEEVIAWYQEGATEDRIRLTLVTTGGLSESEANEVMVVAKERSS
jgi:hypothetical protein